MALDEVAVLPGSQLAPAVDADAARPGSDLALNVIGATLENKSHIINFCLVPQGQRGVAMKKALKWKALTRKVPKVVHKNKASSGHDSPPQT